jgi:hypothetical protein
MATQNKVNIPAKKAHSQKKADRFVKANKEIRKLIAGMEYHQAENLLNSLLTNLRFFSIIQEPS